MDTGKADLVITLQKMAAIAYPNGRPSSGCLYFFREGWNPSATRFIAFVKDPDNGLFKAFSIAADGTDVRYLYDNPSHHSWLNDNFVMDFGSHTPPGGASPLKGYFLFKDDGTGNAKELLWPTEFDGHVTPPLVQHQVCYNALVVLAEFDLSIHDIWKKLRLRCGE